MKYSLDVYYLGNRWRNQLRLDLLKYVPNVYLHQAGWKIDLSLMQSDWWCFFYDVETISINLLKTFPLLVDPALKDLDTEQRYNGFTFFILNKSNTKEFYYSTRLIHKDVPFDFETMCPTINEGFERILDGWIYTDAPEISIHKLTKANKKA